jgi:hypothetical protein
LLIYVSNTIPYPFDLRYFLYNLFLLTLTCYDMGMKYLSIDYGAKKVGIATSDDEGRMAYPCMISENNTSLMSDIKEIVKAMNI